MSNVLLVAFANFLLVPEYWFLRDLCNDVLKTLSFWHSALAELVYTVTRRVLYVLYTFKGYPHSFLELLYLILFLFFNSNILIAVDRDIEIVLQINCTIISHMFFSPFVPFLNFPVVITDNLNIMFFGCLGSSETFQRRESMKPCSKYYWRAYQWEY